ncbi:hypothetical protein [Streptomyces phaeochromogenes]
MATVEVTGRMIGTPLLGRSKVTATLVDLNGTERLGYVASVEGEIVSEISASMGADGSWTLTLYANADVTSDYGDTLYRIREGTAGHTFGSNLYYIAVPSGGPHWVGDILTDPPGGAVESSYAVISVDGRTGVVDLSDLYLSSASASGSYLARSANLSDLANAGTARGNLGLGGAAVLEVGSSVNTVAAGNDSRLSDQRTPSDNSVTSAKIVNETIVNGDISASAGIALSKLETNPLARANHTGTQAASTISDLATVVQAYRLDQFANPNADVSLASHKLTSVTDPTSAQDAATKAFVDSAEYSVRPTDLGMKAWSYDPAAIVAGQTITDGIIYVMAVYPRRSMSVTGLCYFQFNAGASVTSGQAWIGLYDSSGNKMVDAALDSAVTSVGVKELVVSSQNITGGSLYYIALLSNGGGTDPQGGATNGNGAAQPFSGQGLSTGATLRYATNGSAATTLPATLTLASNSTTGAKPYWVGFS